MVILTEAQHVAGTCGITPELTQVKQMRRSTDDLTPEKEFRSNIFLPILDSVIAGLSTRFDAANQINNTFKFLWLYPDMSEDDIVSASTNFAKIYSTDVSEKRLPQRSAAAEEYPQLKYWIGKIGPVHFVEQVGPSQP